MTMFGKHKVYHRSIGTNPQKMEKFQKIHKNPCRSQPFIYFTTHQLYQGTVKSHIFCVKRLIGYGIKVHIKNCV